MRTSDPDAATNVVGVDPHKRTLSACVLDGRGLALAHAHFPVSDAGHEALLEWAARLGPVRRWGVEGAGGLGRHTSLYLVERGADVREVTPTRTADRARGRAQGRSDALDAERIARETLAHPDLPIAFKRAPGDTGPEETHELIRLWHNARRSLLKSRQHLLNEAEALLGSLPQALRGALPDTRAVRPRLNALAGLAPSAPPAPLALGLRLLAEQAETIAELDRREREATSELARLVEASGSRLGELVGLAARSVAELLVEVGDPRRFASGGFARFNGTAPLPASSGEGGGPPRRHRLNRGGNRRVNAVLHRMAVTQLRVDPRAQQIYAQARGRGHTKRAAMRILKRHLSNVIWRQMTRDLTVAQAETASA